MNPIRWLLLSPATIGIYLLLSSLSAYSQEDRPTREEIKTWKVENATGSFEFFDKNFAEIYLVGGDKAYLAPVTLRNEGRNNMFQTALLIPSEKKVILLSNTIIKSVERVTDLDKNQVSEIFVKNSASGQGSEAGERAIVQLSPTGNIIILRQASFENNEGFSGKQSSVYVKRDVDWKFNSDESNVQLTETLITEKGNNGKEPTTNKAVKYFSFDGTKFIERND